MYPGRGLSTGLFACVIVSPTCISDKLLILAEIYPTSPALISSLGKYEPGAKYPTSVTIKVSFEAISLISSPGLTFPSTTLT